MRIRTQGNQAFNVPNTEEGHLFIRLLRKFRNRSWHYRARGRGSRQEHGDQHGIPQEFAEWFAVYLKDRKAQFVQSFARDTLVNMARAAVRDGSNQTNDITMGYPQRDLWGNLVRFDTDADFWLQAPAPAQGGIGRPVAEKADDTVELTAKEQGLLEEILFKLHSEYVTQNWTEEKQEIFDSLFEKLVD